MAVITKRKRQYVEAIVAKVCDRCGLHAESARDWPSVEFNEFLTIRWTAGYGSLLTDGDTYQADFCQKCTQEMIHPYARVAEKGFSWNPSNATLEEIFPGLRKKRGD